MDTPPDDLDALEKLLRLKRHEPPPPRYFKDFSGRVLGRIERGEGRLSWWERFGFDLRPALAAVAGLAACALIVYGVATTDGDAGNAGGTGPLSFGGNVPPTAGLLADSEKAVAANSTNPVSSYGTPIDRKIFGAPVLPVSFQPQ